MSDNLKRCGFKGKVSNVVIKETHTPVGPLRYAVATINPLNSRVAAGPFSTIAFDDSAIELLKKSKVGDVIHSVGYLQENPNEDGKSSGGLVLLEKVSYSPIIPYIDENNLRATNFAQVGRDLVDLLFEKENTARINATISTLLVVASRMGRLDEVPAELKAKEVLSREVPTGQTIFHDIAEFGQFKGFDRSLLTPEMLSLKNKNGDAPIHLMAKNQRLMYFSKEVITPELLDLEDKEGNTPVHLAAGTYSLRYLPVEFLTDDRMLKKNQDGVTPIIVATYGRSILSVPKEVMRSKLLLEEDEEGTAIIDLVSDYNIKQVVRLFPDKTLRDYIEREGGNYN